jgi:hypothetical protein
MCSFSDWYLPISVYHCTCSVFFGSFFNSHHCVHVCGDYFVQPQLNRGTPKARKEAYHHMWNYTSVINKLKMVWCKLAMFRTSTCLLSGQCQLHYCSSVALMSLTTLYSLFWSFFSSPTVLDFRRKVNSSPLLLHYLTENLISYLYIFTSGQFHARP